MSTPDTGKATVNMLQFGLLLTAVIGSVVAGIVQFFHLSAGGGALTAALVIYAIAFCLTGNLTSDHGQRWSLMLGAAAGAAGGTHLAQQLSGPLSSLLGGALIAVLTVVGMIAIPSLGRSIFK